VRSPRAPRHDKTRPSPSTSFPQQARCVPRLTVSPRTPQHPRTSNPDNILTCIARTPASLHEIDCRQSADAVAVTRALKAIAPWLRCPPLLRISDPARTKATCRKTPDGNVARLVAFFISASLSHNLLLTDGPRLAKGCVVPMLTPLPAAIYFPHKIFSCFGRPHCCLADSRPV
jgi:hypothetical protein